MRLLAAATAEVTIGTSVLILPQRHPVEVSKMAATLADLSDGRFVLGVGAGWSRREMRLLGWDPATRGLVRTVVPGGHLWTRR